MRVVVVGSLPPPDNETSRRLLAEVLSYREKSDEVTVVAPSDYAVAHHRLNLRAPTWPAELARLIRGAGEVVVQIEPGFPLSPGAGRARRTASLAALALCLRTARASVTVRVPSLYVLPLGLGGRVAGMLWGAADRIVAGDDETEAVLLRLGPALAGKVEGAAPVSEPPRPALEALEGTGADLLQSATALVRARAASERSLLARRSSPPGFSPVRVPLWEWVPEPGAGVPRFGGLPEVHRPVPAPPPQVSITRALLYAAERRPATRPFARGARRARALVTRR